MLIFRYWAMMVLTAAFATPALAAKVGDVAPPFVVTTFDKQKISLDDLKGKVVVINYWATWCAPCRVELPILDDYIREHPGTDLKVFAVTTEGSVPDGKLKPLAAVLAFPLIHKLSGRGYGKKKNAVPTNYVIDRAGVIRHAAAGAFTARSFARLVDPLLAERSPVPVAAQREASR